VTEAFFRPRGSCNSNRVTFKESFLAKFFKPGYFPSSRASSLPPRVLPYDRTDSSVPFTFLTSSCALLCCCPQGQLPLEIHCPRTFKPRSPNPLLGVFSPTFFLFISRRSPADDYPVFVQSMVPPHYPIDYTLTNSLGIFLKLRSFSVFPL